MKSKNCSCCNTPFACGNTETSTCWCNQYPALFNLGSGQDCLCQDCLHQETIRKIDNYVANITIEEALNNNKAKHLPPSPRIAGIDSPDHKKILYSLQYLYGVGPKVAQDALSEAQVDPDKRARDLNGDELNRIQRALEKFMLEGNLRRIINDNVDRLKRIKSYRGARHAAGLPSRGQRTRSNARTKRGAKRTVGSMTKEMAAKLDTAKTGK